MNQLKNHLPLALLALLVLKQLFVGTNAAEMGVSISLAAIVGLKDFLEKQKKIQEIEKIMKQEVEEMKSVIKTQNEVIEKMAKAIDENRTGIASLKLSQNMIRKGA